MMSIEMDLRLRALRMVLDREMPQRMNTAAQQAAEDVEAAEVYLKFLQGGS